MPSWWRKSSSKHAKKKVNKESFIDTIHRKFKCVSEEKCSSKSRASQRRCSDTVSEKGTESHVESQSPMSSNHVARCQSFVERCHAQPLPLPVVQHLNMHCTDSGNNVLTRPGVERDPKPSPLPLPRPGRHIPNQSDPADAEVEFATTSLSSDHSIDSDDPSDSHLLSPQASDYENGNRTTMNSPSSVKQKDQSPGANIKQTKREKLRPANILLNNQTVPTSPKWGPLSSRLANLQMPHPGAFYSAPDSSISSPSRSPMRTFGHGLVMNSGLWAGKPNADLTLLGSGHCSSPGSGHNSGHSSVGGDVLGPVFWQHSRYSPECSPLPSPRMTSPGPGSRIHSGAVTPVHPRAGGPASESLANRPEDGMQRSHRLPHPRMISNPSPFSTSYSTVTTPVPKSPGGIDSFLGPGSRWKKGRLLGRGTFGHVYFGFNSENGEMCAMKEVTLFSDDPKSKESAQQLGQEISLLSRLRHPNIVQYYGSETINDKLYIYLEYVSGGSIYRLLQEYGQLGEAAIQSYTQQILSGLAYLHAKNTVHRDIKGANILVDPHGRVKLADFGMAKHITGQSCPLSFKGSPYWMAPEVIKNSNGCNLAVDIWSLGCTVLEMATAKPPWSQYEGVAAMFKIGNSKELPAIPNHLSDDGKLFVKQCLQRNPLNRPTAAQLLEHPFVKNTAPVERPNLCSESLESIPAASAVGSPVSGIGPARNPSCLEPEAVNHNGCPKTGSTFSDSHMPKYMLCPVSPIGSPVLHSRSPQHMSGRLSPSAISSPQATPSSSTTGGSSTSPFQWPKQLTNYLLEGISPIPWSPNNFYPNGNTTYQDLKPDIFQGSPQGSYLFGEVFPSESAFNGGQFGQPLQGSPREIYDGQSLLADRLSQQLLGNHVKLNSDPNPGYPVLGRSGI